MSVNSYRGIKCVHACIMYHTHTCTFTVHTYTCVAWFFVAHQLRVCTTYQSTLFAIPMGDSHTLHLDLGQKICEWKICVLTVSNHSYNGSKMDNYKCIFKAL